jgi:hypothetical protein
VLASRHVAAAKAAQHAYVTLAWIDVYGTENLLAALGRVWAYLIRTLLAGKLLL